jgi:hypothetical protein
VSAPGSVFDEVARLCFPSFKRGGIMLMLAAYFDDSGTHTTSRVVVWGGFMTTAEKWASLNEAWQAKLARPLAGKAPLEKFALADCQGCREAFTGYSRAESDLLQNEFRQLIVDANLVGMTYAADCDDWQRLVTGPALDYFGDAETVCFSACFNGAIERARRFFDDDLMLSLHFDRGRKSPKLDAIVGKVTTAYKGAPEIVNISFNRVKDFPGLQTADIIATENYWHAKGVIEGNVQPRPHFDHFLKRGHTNGYILQEPDILSTLRMHGF